MWANPAGVATGRSPMPAPVALHQAPRCGRRSTLEALTYVLTSVEVLAAVGRVPPVDAFTTGQFDTFVQPQPFRDVSISMPIVLGNPPEVSRVHMSLLNVASSTSALNSNQLEL